MQLEGPSVRIPSIYFTPERGAYLLQNFQLPWTRSVLVVTSPRSMQPFLHCTMAIIATTAVRGSLHIRSSRAQDFPFTVERLLYMNSIRKLQTPRTKFDLLELGRKHIFKFKLPKQKLETDVCYGIRCSEIQVKWMFQATWGCLVFYIKDLRVCLVKVYR